MKKEIILGVCVTTLILLVAPTISAQQYKQTEEAFQLEIQEKIDTIIISLQNIDTNTNELEIHKENIINTFHSLKQNIELNELDIKPTFIKFILSTIISLIFAILGTLFGIVFGPILAILIQVITAPAVLLAKIISFLLGENASNIV